MSPAVKASGKWAKPSLTITHSCNRPAVCNWSSVKHLRTYKLTTLRTEPQNNRSFTAHEYRCAQRSILRPAGERMTSTCRYNIRTAAAMRYALYSIRQSGRPSSYIFTLVVIFKEFQSNHSWSKSSRFLSRTCNGSLWRWKHWSVRQIKPALLAFGRTLI